MAQWIPQRRVAVSIGPGCKEDGPVPVRGDGAENSSSARTRVLGNNGEGKPSMRARHTRLDGDINMNLKERDSDTLEDL